MGRFKWTEREIVAICWRRLLDMMIGLDFVDDFLDFYWSPWHWTRFLISFSKFRDEEITFDSNQKSWEKGPTFSPLKFPENSSEIRPFQKKSISGFFSRTKINPTSKISISERVSYQQFFWTEIPFETGVIIYDTNPNNALSLRENPSKIPPKMGNSECSFWKQKLSQLRNISTLVLSCLPSKSQVLTLLQAVLRHALQDHGVVRAIGEGDDQSWSERTPERKSVGIFFQS